MQIIVWFRIGILKEISREWSTNSRTTFWLICISDWELDLKCSKGFGWSHLLKLPSSHWPSLMTANRRCATSARVIDHWFSLWGLLASTNAQSQIALESHRALAVTNCGIRVWARRRERSGRGGSDSDFFGQRLDLRIHSIEKADWIISFILSRTFHSKPSFVRKLPLKGAGVRAGIQENGPTGCIFTN